MVMLADTNYAATATQRAPRPSLLARIATAIIDARMAQARRQVDAHLMTMDDATLARYGIDRAMVRSSQPGARTL